MTDIVKAPPFMPSKPQWDATVKLLERALEELAQAQASAVETARIVGAERDAARAEVARLRAECNDAQAVARAYILRAERAEMDANKWAILANGRANALDAARAEVARLTAIVEKLQAERLDRLADSVAELDQQERIALRQPAPAQYPIDDEPCENCVHGKKWHWDGGKCQNACPCEQYEPAPAQAWCNCGMGDGTMPELHSSWCAVQQGQE